MDYLRPLPPRFWSIRMYNGLTRYSVPNPINRYSLGSDNDLKKNADGSFTLFLQADSPLTHESRAPVIDFNSAHSVRNWKLTEVGYGQISTRNLLSGTVVNAEGSRICF